MKLDSSEIKSPAWQKIQEHLKERLESLRKSNDDYVDSVSSAKTSGQIKEVKSLLKLGAETHEPILLNVEGGDEIPPEEPEEV